MDGAVGTELIRRGYRARLPLWSAGAIVETPELLYQIHCDYFKAGAHIALTNTFRTTPYTYQKARVHPQKACDDTRLAVAIARRAQAHYPHTFVGGVITTLDDCYDPTIVPASSILEREHEAQICLIKALKVDFLMIETIHTQREAHILARYAHRYGLPFLISFVVDQKGCLLSGEPIQGAIQATNFPERMGVLLNCGVLDSLPKGLEMLRATYDGIAGVYPNGLGSPQGECGWRFDETPEAIDHYTRILKELQHSWDLKILGGCCGTTPAYIQNIVNCMAL